MSKPSLIEGLDQVATREQARALLEDFHTEKLDAFRVAVVSMKTSELFWWLSNPEVLCVSLTEDDQVQANDPQALIAAATMAICEEIDRRVPLPKFSGCDPDARGSFVPRVPRR